VNLAIVLPLLAVLVLLRLIRAGLFATLMTVWVVLYLFFSLGFRTPVPHAAVEMYMGIASAAMAAYVLSGGARAREFFGPLVRLIVERRFAPLLLLVLLAVPALAAFNVYRQMNVAVDAPFFARTIHPSPPASITVHDQEIDLIRADNPFRPLKQSDPEAYAQHVQNGRDTYYKNCFYCHGDGLAGDGMFAHGLNPIPTNFTDAGVLPNFRESFFFWRVSKGGPGMPEEGGPWDSAMPQWERFLSEDEIWEVVLFLYDFTDYPPRPVGAAEEH